MNILPREEGLTDSLSLIVLQGWKWGFIDCRKQLLSSPYVTTREGDWIFKIQFSVLQREINLVVFSRRLRNFYKIHLFQAFIFSCMP